MKKEDRLRGILENVLFAHHDDISKQDDDNINNALTAILKEFEGLEVENEGLKDCLLTRDYCIKELKKERNAFQTQAGARKRETFELKQEVKQLKQRELDEVKVEKVIFHHNVIKIIRKLKRPRTSNKELRLTLGEGLKDLAKSIATAYKEKRI